MKIELRRNRLKLGWFVVLVMVIKIHATIRSYEPFLRYSLLKLGHLRHLGKKCMGGKMFICVQ